MVRFWVMAALALMAMTAGLTQAGDKDFKVQGMLTKDDPKDQQRGGPSQTHVVPLKAGKVYTIDMVSTEVDSYLRLLDPKGTQIAEDDDSGGNQNSRIIFNCTMDGEYKLVCTTFDANMRGSYTLTVKAGGNFQKPATAHAKMIGKDAPDFEGDFAVNGKPVKLSDLQGKVVLLDFWEVRSERSAAFLPRLSEWGKLYKMKGLEVVSVTFYLSDINQRLTFDKETGGVKTAEKADRKSDQELLRAFAAHHKVDHLLIMIPGQDALDTFGAYAVNSVPQLVLIDRKGMVRLIDISGGKNSGAVETEIKKLLAEK